MRALIAAALFTASIAAHADGLGTLAAIMAGITGHSDEYNKQIDQQREQIERLMRNDNEVNSRMQQQFQLDEIQRQQREILYNQQDMQFQQRGY